jgi:hypothetical protein
MLAAEKGKSGISFGTATAAVKGDVATGLAPRA